MRANSHRWIGFSAVALLLAAGGGVTLGMRDPTHPSIRLEYGARVTLMAVTHGTGPAVVGSPLERLLYTVLPGKLKDRSGAKVCQMPQWNAGRTYWGRW